MAIGKPVEERLHQETDGGCGICGIRDQRVLTIHHINHGGAPRDDSYENLIVLCHNCHQSYHQGKGPQKDEILRIKKRLIRRTLTQFGINALKEATRKNLVSGAPFLLNHLYEMGYLEFDEILMGSPKQIDIACYRITKRGSKLLDNWKF